MNSIKYDKYKLSKTQKEVFDLLVKGKNLFITGSAGTGKSYLLNTYINYLKINKINFIVTAPTGVGAINVGGSTLHRVFGIKAGIIPQDKNPDILDTLLQIDVLIIDEVSMVRLDIFEYVMKCIKSANEKKNKNTQIVLVGDFLQLPPVIKKHDYATLKMLYPNIVKGYPFESKYWVDYTIIILKEVLRQNNQDLIENLNKARIGDTSCIDYFNNKSCKENIKNAITLCPTNSDVDRINYKELNQIESKEEYFFADTTGDVEESDVPAECFIALKEGARVMSLINDIAHSNYQNGSLGTIKSIVGNEVTVHFDNGNIEVFKPYKWYIKKYEVDKKTKKVKENIVGTYCQIPLKLAYAISIHKSQGQTFNEVNIIPNCFADGQLYVALSRIIDINGMHLVSKIKPEYLKTDKNVINFYNTQL